MRGPEELIPIGRIIGPHGIRGQVKLRSYSGNAETLRQVRTVYLVRQDGTAHEQTLGKLNENSGRFIVSFQGIAHIDQALPWAGCELCVKRRELPQLTDDEYYWDDLIGLAVETDGGITLGRITDIFETGSNDVYVVKSSDREYLIPAIADVISQVDLAAGVVVITPLDGLLDL